MITSGTVAAARIDNLSGSTITIDPGSLVLFGTPSKFDGNLGGRSGADAICLTYVDNESFSMINSCSNVRAVISVSATDEIRDMASNYSIPTNRKIRGRNGIFLGDGWDNVTGGTGATYGLEYPLSAGVPELQIEYSIYHRYWTGSDTDASLKSNNCNGWTTNASSSAGEIGTGEKQPYISGMRSFIDAGDHTCNYKLRLLCVCY